MKVNSKANTALAASDRAAASNLRASSSEENEEDRAPHWQITDFQTEKLLGQGRFGRVYLAICKQSGHKVALKVIKKDAVLQNQTYLELRREIEIQSHLSHRHITKLFGYFHDAENVYMVLEAIDGGSLFQQLHAQELGFSEPLTAKFVVQIAAALDYLSRRCVIHRDLKLENILVCATTGRAKISDFGCAVHTIEDSRSTFCGTIEYLSPEIVKKERYDARVDLWSLGVLMYEMLFKDSPFKSTQQELTLEKIRTINFSFPDEKRMISDEAKDLIRKLLSAAEVRIATQDIIRHPFILRNIESNTPTKSGLRQSVQHLEVSGQLLRSLQSRTSKQRSDKAD